VPEPAEAGRLTVTPGLLADIADRLTARDRWLLAMLHEHRVLTTTHITQLAFGTSRAATARMVILHRYQLADRFRPLAAAGSAPWHFVLGPAGAHVLAAQYGLTPGQLGYRRDRALAAALSPRLGHDTGASGFFTALAARARTAGNARLACWWSEHRCAALWGDLARPDGYGRWHEHAPGGGSGGTDFFLEYDTGAEDLPRLAGRSDRHHHPGAVLAAWPAPRGRAARPPPRRHRRPGPGVHRHPRQWRPGQPGVAARRPARPAAAPRLSRRRPPPARRAGRRPAGLATRPCGAAGRAALAPARPGSAARARQPARPARQPSPALTERR